jgi:HD-GYP domain-containing protein (c-di-GMP phosphodiesterase class II)
MMLAARQIELFEVGRRKASLAAALGFSWLGASSLIWFISGPSDAVVWLAHLLDASGVLAAAAGLVLGHRSNRAVTTVLAPILNRDPAVALRLGITPQIESFVARIETKDVSTAGHVTRVAELAMRLGERGGIGGDRLRTIGLAALLHDIGKIRVPTEILTKPDKLTDEEFAIIKRHPEWGQEILDSDSLLAPVGRLVRGHHERVDGRGYPDGLSGDAVTLDMGLVAVTDSWDAMVQNRHYRAGMSHDQARAIFVEHAGAQWPTRAVELLLEHLDEEGQLDAVFADLLTESNGHVCDDALAGLPV